MSYNTHSATSNFSNPDSQHPFFANHPTQTYAGSTNDIVIGANNVKPKMNKKPFIIGGIILIAIVIVCIVVAVTLGQTESSLKRSLNSYANYLLYGNESDVKITQKYLGVNYRYYVVEQALKDNSDNKTEYFDKLLQKYDDFLLISEQDKKLSSEQKNDISLYYAQLRAFSDYSETERITEDAILQYFTANGYDKSRLAIESQYSSLVDSQYEVASILGDYLVREAIFFLDLGMAYEEAGCITANSVNMNCVSASSMTINVQNNDNIISIQDGIASQVITLKDNVLSGYWRLYNAL